MTTTRRTAALTLALAALPALAAAPLAAQEPAAPAPAEPAVEAPAEAAAPAPRRSLASWTADRREFRVGDVITVLVDEYTLASADKRDYNADRRSRDMIVSAGAGAGLGTGASADVLTANDAESRRSGEALRQNQFRGEVTTRVVAIDNGLLQVEGRKRIEVDGNEEELILSGWIRPADVSARNLIDSWRVGDAEIVYRSDKDLGRPKGGILGRMLGWIWP